MREVLKLMRSTGDSHAGLSNASHRLQRLAKGFYIIGNETVAEELDEIALLVREESSNIQGNYAQIQNIDLASSRAATGEILKALTDNI